MKAAQINEYGGPEVVQTTDDAPKPTPGEGQVLVEVYAASANPFDSKVRAGNLKESVPLKFPATLGGDVAGVVSDLGAGVSGFQIGDAVYGQAGALSGVGSFAEYAPVKAQQLALKPKSLDFITAAAVPLAASSAHQALIEHLDLKSGQKILIHGGAGGIGSFAVQLAKHLGVYVATTASGNDAEFVKSLGADEVIDYKTQDFTTIIKDYDAVFDTVPGGLAVKSYPVLKTGGRLVSMIEMPNEELASQRGITAIHQQSHVTTQRLTELAELIDSGALKIFADKVFPLDEAGAALGYLDAGGHHGKVVIQVK
jgi:NADPH:quinone reductase-like Zn-dependent oxidoreductase